MEELQANVETWEKERNNKYYEAILLSTKVWIWLYKNLWGDKMDSPYWEKICDMRGFCPLCRYHMGWCEPCILFKCGACRDAFTRQLGNSKHVAYYYSLRHQGWDFYKGKCARAFIASKLRRELRRLQMKDES